MESIPVIDISAYLSANAISSETAIAIGNACRTYGFFYISNHGIPLDLQTRLESQSRDFFSLPLEIKQKIGMKLGGRAWRGFFPVGDELTSGKPDMKEGLYFGAELGLGHPMVLARKPLHGPNLFPDDQVPGLRSTVLEYLDRMNELGHAVMRAIAVSLNLDSSYFLKYFSPDPLPLFRIFNYPATENVESLAEESWGVGEHTDYGVLTLLKQDHLGGLQVKLKSGEWIEAPPIPNTFVCNIGDMLDRITGGLYRSTPHRVKRPQENVDRLSFPFFFDPNFEAQVRPIEGLQKKQEEDDKDFRWDKASVHAFQGTYGEYLLAKVSKVFPQLKQDVL